MKILFTPSARRQFLSGIGYIRRDNPLAAVRFRRKAEKGLRRLIRYPKSGRLVPEFPELPYREIVVSPYRFFYRVHKGNIWIVAVWHGAQLAAPPSDKGIESNSADGD